MTGETDSGNQAEDKFFGIFSAPAWRDSDAIFFVDGVTKSPA